MSVHHAKTTSVLEIDLGEIGAAGGLQDTRTGEKLSCFTMSVTTPLKLGVNINTSSGQRRWPSSPKVGEVLKRALGIVLFQCSPRRRRDDATPSGRSPSRCDVDDIVMAGKRAPHAAILLSLWIAPNR